MISFPRLDELRQQLIELNGAFAPADRLGPWRGSWQIDYAKLICDNQYSTLQGPVQWTGKTMIGCLFTCAALLEGYRGIIAFPTLRQGGRVALRRVSTYMTVLEERYGIERSKPDAALEKTWSNGAIFCALSTNEEATAGIQGYTFDFIWVDEGHEVIANRIMGPLFSRAELAMAAGHGRIFVTGVSGAEDSKTELADGSLIEHVQTTSYFKSIRLDTAAVAKMYPASKPAFARARELNTPQHFDQYYDCKPLTATSDALMFPRLGNEPVDGVAAQEHRFTVDVARGGQSRTMCSHFIRSMLSDGSLHHWLEDALEIDYSATDAVQQYRAARLIADFILHKQSPNDLNELQLYSAQVAIEVNGPGKELADTIAARYPQLRLRRIHTNDQPPRFRKSNWILPAMRDAYTGRLTLRLATHRSELGALKYSSQIADGYNKYIWPKSDLLSTIWLYYAQHETITLA